MNNANIVIIQRIFSHYRKPIFDALSKKYNIKLLHGKIDNNIKQEVADYSYLIDIYKYGSGQTKCILNVFGALFKIKPKIIIHEFTPSILSLPILLLFKKLFGYKVILWGHGYNHNKKFEPYKKIDSLIRVLFMRWADATILYGKNAKNEIKKYISPKKLFVAHNTLDMSTLIKLRDNYRKVGKDKVKKDIGFNTKYNIIFIGRLLRSKFPRYCIDVLKVLNAKFPNQVSLHYVGDGPELDGLKNYADELALSSSVFFHGAVYNEELAGNYLFASDLMLMPGHLGLSVNHALGFDCPVFSFYGDWGKGPFHAPESEYVINGKSGFFAESRNIEQLSGLIIKYLNNTELQKSIHSQISYVVENVCSLENMITGFDECIHYVNRER